MECNAAFMNLVSVLKTVFAAAVSDRHQHNFVQGSNVMHGRRLMAPSADILLGRTAVPLLPLLSRTTGLSY